MRKFPFFIATVAALALPVHAQLNDTSEKTQAKCAEYLKTPLPAEVAAVETPKSWPKCASYRLYSGIGTKVDFEAARKCSWSERLAVLSDLQPKYTVGSIFGGAAMLTQLYANGEGAYKNIPLALRFACEAEGAPAEIGIRIESLENGQNGDHFDFCDATTSGFMMGFCTAYASEIADQKRAKDFDTLQNGWTNSQKSAFLKLKSVQETYARAHAKGEVDLSGTARAMFQIDEQDGLRDNFLEASKSFEQGHFPQASPAEAVAADSQLNREYQKAIAEAETRKSEYGAIQPDGIRAAERAWLKYRDAWMIFARQRYPSVSTEAWVKLLSDDRVLVLQGKCCGPAPDMADATYAPRPLP